MVVDDLRLGCHAAGGGLRGHVGSLVEASSGTRQAALALVLSTAYDALHVGEVHAIGRDARHVGVLIYGHGEAHRLLRAVEAHGGAVEQAAGQRLDVECLGV